MLRIIIRSAWCTCMVLGAQFAFVVPASSAESPVSFCLIVAPRGAAVETRQGVQRGNFASRPCGPITPMDADIVVCVEDERRPCERVRRGRSWTPTLGGGTPDGGFWLAKVADVLLGTRFGARFGSSKAGEADRKPGFPYGSVLPGDLTIDPPDRGRFDTFVIVREGRAPVPVLRAAAGAFPVVVPAQRLEPGGGYRWEARIGPQTFGGGFTVVRTEEADEVRREVEQVRADADLPAAARAIMIAGVYEDHQLFGERDRELAPLRQ